MQSFNDYLADTLSPVDIEQRYAEYLDEFYSFESVGGPFANMSPAEVLDAMDPVAFSCGVADWSDGEDFVEFGGDYYDYDEFHGALKDYRESLADAIIDVECDIDILTDHMAEQDEDCQNWEDLTRDLEGYRQRLKTLNDYETEIAYL